MNISEEPQNGLNQDYDRLDDIIRAIKRVDKLKKNRETLELAATNLASMVQALKRKIMLNEYKKRANEEYISRRVHGPIDGDMIGRIRLNSVDCFGRPISEIWGCDGYSSINSEDIDFMNPDSE